MVIVRGLRVAPIFLIATVLLGICTTHSFAASQQVKAAVIAIELNDAPYVRDVEALNDLFSSATSYFLEASYNTFTLKFTVFGWFKMDRATRSYGMDSPLCVDDPNADGSPDSYRLIEDAIQLADSTVDFAKFEHLVIVHSGSGQECTGNPDDIWSCAYLLGIWFRTNEKSFNKAAIVPETQVRGGNPIGVIVHETGHLLGLPDLYSYDEQVGPWDVMGRGTWLGYPAGAIPALFCAYSRMKLGWLSSSQIHTYGSGSEVIELAPLAVSGPGIKAVKIPLREDGHYYLVEYRMKTGFDSALPQSGILITKIQPGAPFVKVMRCDGRSLEEAIWPSGYVFTDSSINLFVGLFLLPSGVIEVSMSVGSAPPFFPSPIPP